MRVDASDRPDFNLEQASIPFEPQSSGRYLWILESIKKDPEDVGDYKPCLEGTTGICAGLPGSQWTVVSGLCRRDAMSLKCKAGVDGRREIIVLLASLEPPRDAIPRGARRRQ